ncbi:MAG: Purine nucleoside phosphoramidase [Myxococcota bacterium]|nr:Purine nucleoside phosphoramidase [Myxococcota bacterium]
MSTSSDCIFCKIISGAIPSRKIFEDGQVFAFHDISPVANVHFLVVPKIHIQSLNHLKPEHEAVMGRMLRVGSAIAQDLGLGESGYRTVINTNADAGQTVFHIHLHVIGGRPMGWPPFGK